MFRIKHLAEKRCHRLNTNKCSIYIYIYYLYTIKRHSDSCNLLILEALRATPLVCVSCDGSLVSASYGSFWAAYSKVAPGGWGQVGGPHDPLGGGQNVRQNGK